MEQQDRCLNDSIPRLRLNATALDFQCAPSDGTLVQTLIIKNTGKFDAGWQILSRPPQTSLSGPDNDSKPSTPSRDNFSSVKGSPGAADLNGFGTCNRDWLEVRPMSGDLACNEVSFIRHDLMPKINENCRRRLSKCKFGCTAPTFVGLPIFRPR
jgi:hypothetical protein